MHLWGSLGTQATVGGFSRKPVGFSDRVCFRPLRGKGLGQGSVHKKEESRGRQGTDGHGVVVRRKE